MTGPTTDEVMDVLTANDWHMDYDVARGLIDKGTRYELAAQGAEPDEYEPVVAVALADFDRFVNTVVDESAKAGAHVILDLMREAAELRQADRPRERLTMADVFGLIDSAREHYLGDDEPKAE